VNCTSKRVLSGRIAGMRSFARSVFNSRNVKSSVNHPVSETPSIILVVRRSASSGCSLTSVVPLISFSWRATRMPSLVMTRSGSMKSALLYCVLSYDLVACTLQNRCPGTVTQQLHAAGSSRDCYIPRALVMLTRFRGRQSTVRRRVSPQPPSGVCTAVRVARDKSWLDSDALLLQGCRSTRHLVVHLSCGVNGIGHAQIEAASAV
jgi:hypothetical protein